MKRDVPQLLWAFLCLSCCLVSCKKQMEVSSFENVTESISLQSAVGDEALISFTSASTWEATTEALWLNLSPVSGDAGEGRVKVTVLSENHSNVVRTAEVELRSGNEVHKIAVSQEIGDYVIPESEECLVGVEGGEVRVRYESNVSAEKLKVYTSSETGSWLEERQPVFLEGQKEVVLYAASNKGGMSRMTYLLFVREVDGQQTNLATVKISQQGGQVLESSDFSEDGLVDTLQLHEKGNGIPIVLMGDGFVDVEIKNGTYRRVMEKAVENLFSEEPVKSLKDYFDVLMINAVSENNDFGAGYQTAFSCKIFGGNNPLITGDDVSVQVYVRKALKNDELKKNCLAVVLLNTTFYAGTTYLGYKDVNEKFLEFAISYCPVIESMESERFRQVLVHEAVGHGFGKLEDEYAYEDRGNISALEMQKIRIMQKNGWSQNVDFTAVKDSVLWSAFLKDARYEAEGLGVYEGACSYPEGVFRPSENSMMNASMSKFNAPSRMALYTKVMSLGLSEKVGYEDFVGFDRQHLPDNLSSGNSRSGEKKPFAHPVWMNKRLLP